MNSLDLSAFTIRKSGDAVGTNAAVFRYAGR
jgi:hypothetical protein